MVVHLRSSSAAKRPRVPERVSRGNPRNREIRTGRILSELESGRVVVAAGFQGFSEDGEITTLGRGGSDTTATALAAALGAGECHVFSDVDGVYTTGPRICRDARRLDHRAQLRGRDARALAVTLAPLLTLRALGRAVSAPLGIVMMATALGATFAWRAAGLGPRDRAGHGRCGRGVRARLGVGRGAAREARGARVPGVIEGIVATPMIALG